MSKADITDKDRALLSKEEQAVLDEESEDGPDEKALAELADEQDEGEKKDEKPADKEGEADAGPGEEEEDEEEEDDADDGGNAADANEGEEAPAEVKAKEGAADFAPSMRPTLNDEQKARMDKLTAQFEANEITTQAYLDGRDAIRDEAIEEHVARQRWEWECGRFMDDHEEYRSDKVLFSMWNAIVKDLGADEANANRSSRWFLDQAHKMVQERVKPAPAAAPKEGETKGKEGETRAAAQPKPKPRVADRTGVPKTLAGVPTATAEETGDGEFAALERLMETNPLEAERAFAKLPKEKQQRFLEAA